MKTLILLIKNFFDYKKEILTFFNIKEGLWVIDDENTLYQITILDKDIRERYPNERTFSYKIYKAHSCWTSVYKNPTYNNFYILKNWIVPFLKMKVNLFKKNGERHLYFSLRKDLLLYLKKP